MKINFKIFLVCAALIAAFSLDATAQRERRLLPVDEAGKDASFKSFRDKLIRAVRQHDAKYVLSVVDPNIKNGFGGEDGIANFRKQWKPNDAKSQLWDELLFVLTHGGAFRTEGGNKMFTAPYIFSNFPQNLDAFEYSAITENRAGLYARPSAASRLVANLSYHIVKVDFNNSVKTSQNSNKYSWLKVTTLGDKTGFVREKSVRSSIDYRAGFEKKRGTWKMIYFLAGD